MIAAGPCVICGQRFPFDPDGVPSVLIDPETGRPPDVDKHGQHVTPNPAAVARSVARPYCPACAVTLNDLAAAQGRGRPFDETDTSRGMPS